MRTLEDRYGRGPLVDALRAEADAIRSRLASGESIERADEAIEAGAAARLAAAAAPSLRRVVNATGVVVHTNLGRAPLARAAAERAATLARGYTNLEYDLAAGARGHRHAHAERLICRLTGAESAAVVNNNAAATLLALAALASGREAIISRGELVEIGGGFRVPDVMAQSGAILREVGTTNRTRAADYAAAISERTALILRVHPSNFRIEGFTERPSLAEITTIARRFRVLVVEDIGSGYLGDPAASESHHPLSNEPAVPLSIRDGADVVMFSGDKLLGGPQAGIIAGSAAALERIRSHPLMRAVRVDKLIYAALEATLAEYEAGRAERTVPVARMIALGAAEIGVRARALASRLASAGLAADVIDGSSTIGGGSAPGSALPTRLVRLAHPALGADTLLRRLREYDPPVIARIDDDRVVIDLRTVEPEDDDTIARAIAEIRTRN